MKSKLEKIIVALLLLVNIFTPVQAQEPDYVKDGVLEDEPIQETNTLTDISSQSESVESQQITLNFLGNSIQSSVANTIEEGIIEADQIEELQTETTVVTEQSSINLNNIDFSSNRLILETEKENIRKEENISFNYENIFILEYENLQKTKDAYIYYLSKGINVEPDIDVWVTNNEPIDGTLEPNELESNPEDNLPQEKTYEGALALLDTGITDLQKVYDAISLIDDSPLDENGHGSLMTDFILEENPQAKIISIKVLDKDARGSIGPIIAGIKWAIENKVSIISLSLCAKKTIANSILEDAINEAVANGIKVVVSAGNGGKDTKDYIPASINSAYVIAALDEDGKYLESSNRGVEVDYGITEVMSTSEATARFSGIISSLLATNQDMETSLFEIEKIKSKYQIIETLDNHTSLVDYDETFTATANDKVRIICVDANFVNTLDEDIPDSVLATVVGSDGSEQSFTLDKDYGYTYWLVLPAYTSGGTPIVYRIYQHEEEGFTRQYTETNRLLIPSTVEKDKVYSSPLPNDSVMTVNQLTTNAFEDAPLGDYRFKGIAMNNLQASQIVEMTGDFRLATVPVYKNTGDYEETITTIVLDRDWQRGDKYYNDGRFTIKATDAFEDVYNRKYDALFMFKNFRFYIGNSFPQDALGQRTLAIINTSPDHIYPRWTDDKKGYMGIEMRVQVQIVDKSGNPASGDVQIYFSDLDIADYSGPANSPYYDSSVYGPYVYGTPNYHATFMEGVRPYAGVTSDVYLTSSTTIETPNNKYFHGTTISGSNSDATDLDSRNAGIVYTANASSNEFYWRGNTHVGTIIGFNGTQIDVNDVTLPLNWTRVNKTINVEKKDESGNFLPGASLLLESCMSQDGTTDIFPTTYTWTSSSSAKQQTLGSGYWKLTETASPQGYDIASPIVFHIKDDGTLWVVNESGSTYTETQLSNSTITMTDQKTMLPLTITKQIQGNMGNKKDYINFKVLFENNIATAATVTASSFTDVIFASSPESGTNRQLTASAQSGTSWTSISFALSHGSSITLLLPSGTKYYVIEERNKTNTGKAAYYTARYKVDSASWNNAITSSSSTQTLSGTYAATPQQTITSQTAIAYENTNTVNVMSVSTGIKPLIWQPLIFLPVLAIALLLIKRKLINNKQTA